MSAAIEAWHFVAENRRLGYDDGRPVEVGATYEYRGRGPIELCERGMHASVRAIDALEYAPSPVICRVRCEGQIIHGDDKLVCTQRTVLAMADARMTLRAFACDVAEKALRAAKVDDPRSWAAIEVTRRWMRGEASDSERVAARLDARAAAWDAARDAAWADARAAAWADARDAQNTRLEALLTELIASEAA